MKHPLPATGSGPDAHIRPDLPSDDRELVGRRGTAPVEGLRSATDYLVAKDRYEPPRPSIDAAANGSDQDGTISLHRHRVSDTELTPWRMVCALRMRSPSGVEATGTGWLAGPRTIITAGHHVHHHGFHGGWAKSIEVCAGRNRNELPFSRFTATRFSALDRWVSEADPDFDIGCIRLDRPLGELVGWFGAAALSPAELDSATVNISGYPSDRGDGCEQHFQSTRIHRIDDRRVHFECDADGALSGSPVWVHRTPSAPPVVVAVHSFGTHGTPFDLGVAARSAPRFTSEVFDMIRSWVREDERVPA